MALIAPKTDFPPTVPHSHAAVSQAKGEFCCVYAAKADTNLNKASQMVLDRTDDKTITIKDFHRDMLDQQVMKADMRAVFTEYAWDMHWCDPCAADPLSHEELRSLGAYWLTETPPDLLPGRGSRPIMPPMGGARDDFDTRMHARYGVRHLPELTGWKLADMREQMNLRTADADNDGKWWQRLWTC
jgi:hypothetical protein